MTLQEFIQQFDIEDAVVLLEGKRNVCEKDKAKLTELGKLLATNTSKMLFRSGNAEGADYFFSDGIASVDITRLQVITPYSGHNKKINLANETISLDELNLSKESDVVYQSKSNKKTENLIDKYISGDRNRYSIKAAYIIRDTVKAIGTEHIKPASFGIFYDDLQKPMEGGTGHTMKVCHQNDIPIIDQRTWLSWLEQ